MWGYYGPDYRLEDSEYLASISAHSRDLAERVAARELRRRTDVRLWIFEILQYATWGDHPTSCRCPLEGLDPEAKVWACAETLQAALAEECDKRDVDLSALMAQTQAEGFSTSDWADLVLSHPELPREAQRASLEYATRKEIRTS